MAKEDGFSSFDALLAREDLTASPWVGGRYQPNLDLLREMISIPISEGQVQESGRTAKAFDAYVAHELRRAGFKPDAVWPRTRRPRVLPEDLAKLEILLGTLGDELNSYEQAKGRLKPPSLRKAIRQAADGLPGMSEASILGDFYAKQIDVAISSWRRGPEVLVSTKTMFSSYRKNLKNRHEEAVGEVDSLRHRHPMAAIGFAFLVRQTIFEEEGAYIILTDILRRLRRPGEAFDATMLLVADWDDAGHPPQVTTLDEPARDLDAERFFTDLIRSVTERTPYGEHTIVRTRRDGEPTGGLPDEDELLDLDIPSD